MIAADAANSNESHVTDLKTQIKVLERKLENSKKIAEASDRLAREAKTNEAKATSAYHALHSDFSRTAERLDVLEGQLQIKRLKTSIEAMTRNIKSKEKRRDEIKYDSYLKQPAKAEKRRELEKVTAELQELRKLLEGQQRLIISLVERQNLADELRRAATMGDLKTVKKLMTLNASVNSADMTGLCAFKYACAHGHLDIVQEMLPYADICNREGNRSPLHISIDHQQWKTAEVLITHGAKVNEMNEVGQSPLHIACSLRSVHGLKILLEKGANVNQQDRKGNSCLHYCTMQKVNDDSTSLIEMASLLLEKGASVRVKNLDGLTPHFVAKTHRMCSVAKIIQTKNDLENM